MRIGINGRFLVAKQTGVQRVAYNLVTALVKIDKKNKYFLFTGQDEITRKEWDFPHVTVVPCKIKPGRTFRNLLWEQIKLPLLAKKYRIDILHSPANMAPLFYKGRSIIHIHDLCFVVNPQWYTFTFRTWYKFVIPRLARRASKVITNSNNSRNDLLKFCKLNVSRVSLVYWAVDNSFVVKEKQQPSAIDSQKQSYILYVGSLEPRKNLKSLIKAYECLRFNYPQLKTKLIIIGAESPVFADIGLNIDNFKEDVILKGFVDDSQLRKYYQEASLVAYPSLYEGFGLPPLEAMASGVPVVTSSTSSIPEVVGEAAVMVNPLDIVALSTAMAKVLLDTEFREKLIMNGFEQVKMFNWYRVARNILAIYYEVLHSSKKLNNPEKAYIPFHYWKELSKLEQQGITL